MSIRAIDWVFRQDVKSPIDKFVLVALADNASDTGMAYPSTETISRKTSMSPRSVIRALDRLVQQRWIEDTGRRTGTTRQIKVYRLNEVTKTDTQAPLKTDTQAPLIAGKTDTQSSKTDTQSPLRLTHSHPEPSEEPLKEPKRQQLSKFIEFLKEDQRFDGLDVEGEIERALGWCRKKNRPVTERFLESWLLHAEQPLEDEEEEGSLACEDYYSWEGWTEERRRALLDLYPEATLPPIRWDKFYPDLKERIEARVKEGWPA